ncbi:dihydroorotase [Bordetella avium]|uniref:Dihydroorotase n=1 Tax=Bordetella avium (strain 197N) TaxID=360910 RepID=Q2KVD8_BORA1|nr:dihydroorotase [Bordetella avium]AZY50250.1 dihydroorotase [Bordetella avium]RIQ11648.1 dihydroorotase [Bordetella avium]RIQ16201.1 dihydroorotase [Bordetella avium]RIQ30909.1 dihydroorotase [Bordetella avium]RIQ35638.1 dihydroorotase [Bordetella avium]
MSNAAQITITRPDDWHLHLRDGAALEAVVGDTARQFARAIIMPNLKPPVTTTEQALAYRERIVAALQKTVGNRATAFNPLMTLYLTDNTPAAEIERAHASGQVYAVKLYPAGATTNSDAGVTDLLGKCGPALTALEKAGMPLLVHGEVTDPAIDVFDREAVFIERVMQPLRRAYPGLKVVFEHITTKDGAEYVRDAEGPIAATITPQHMLYNRNAIFQGGVRPHWYCLPILKREIHRQALVEAATSGSPRFFLGTDSAPHARGLKEHACGCAGCYTALHAMELYATAFENAGALDKLEGFASHHGPDFYGLPRNTDTLTLLREDFTIPQELPFGSTTLVPLAAGEALRWRVKA